MIAKRRGPLGNLHVTGANLETPLPLIDLVNECLENLAANAKTPSATTIPGTVYDTSSDKLSGHTLCVIDADQGPGAQGSSTGICHDPAQLFEALPEHSSPVTPDESTGIAAYAKLKQDFSSPFLPYSQPLDICRSYLGSLDTSRYSVMRRFRKNITEFVLNPDTDPQDFQTHLWRYPVRMDVALEYLCITPEEYSQLFSKDIFTDATSTNPPADQLHLWELYGFDSVEGWVPTARKVSEFLRRNCLTYCEFLELSRSGFVGFDLIKSINARKGIPLPDCEPCCLNNFWIHFIDPKDQIEGLKRLAVFIRLWRKLREVPGAGYTFSELSDICEVLQLFNSNGSINPDFIRQLVAFQMLKDHLDLDLFDEADVQANATGADRTHLLALWIPWSGTPPQPHKKWGWALDDLLDHLQQYAKTREDGCHRSPDFIKLLADNLDPLSILGGFDPSSSTDNWHALPTHTLRFAEILAKIYASKFGVGEILFLFTANDHLDGDDPFPLGDSNESLDFPLDLPDDAKDCSLWALREKLLRVQG